MSILGKTSIRVGQSMHLLPLNGAGIVLQPRNGLFIEFYLLMLLNSGLGFARSITSMKNLAARSRISSFMLSGCNMGHRPSCKKLLILEPSSGSRNVTIFQWIASIPTAICSLGLWGRLNPLRMQLGQRTTFSLGECCCYCLLLTVILILFY